MVSAAVIFGLAVAFCFGTSDYLSKELSGRVGFYRTTVYTLATSGALVVLPTLLLGAPRWPSYSDDGLLVLIAVSTFVAFLFMYRGYQRGNLSVVSPTVNSFPIFSVLFAVVVLKISISYPVLVALVGVILGILLVSTDVSALRSPSPSRDDDGDGGGTTAMTRTPTTPTTTRRRRRGSRIPTPGVPEAMVAAFFFAVALTSLGYAEVSVGYLLPAVAARLGAAFVGVLVGLAWGQDLTPFRDGPLRRVLAMGALEASGILAFALTFFYSASVAVLPITTTLGGMGAVFTVGYAIVLLREEVKLSYAVGILILIVSVGALLYFTA